MPQCYGNCYSGCVERQPTQSLRFALTCTSSSESYCKSNLRSGRGDAAVTLSVTDRSNGAEMQNSTSTKAETVPKCCVDCNNKCNQIHPNKQLACATHCAATIDTYCTNSIGGSATSNTTAASTSIPSFNRQVSFKRKFKKAVFKYGGCLHKCLSLHLFPDLVLFVGCEIECTVHHSNYPPRHDSEASKRKQCVWDACSTLLV